MYTLQSEKGIYNSKVTEIHMVLQLELKNKLQGIKSFP